MKRPIIELQNIRRQFFVGEEIVHALRGLNFTIYEGEFVTIMVKQEYVSSCFAVNGHEQIVSGSRLLTND